MRLDKKYVRESLEEFSKYVVKQSRANLTKGGKNSTKELYNSLGSEITVSKNSFGLDFLMADYGKFQDQGVSGKIKKYNTPFAYKDKMPPAKAFDKWIIKKGIAPRVKGKFVSRESLKFAIARSVFLNGIKPSLFFTKPFNDGFERMPNDVVEAYGLDVESFLKQQLK
jgi:hypothetical protein